MRAVILAGGLGTRLRPYTMILPKPLVPIGERPILELILRRLAAAEINTVDLCVGHLGDLIRVYFEQGTALPAGLQLNWHWEDEPLGTAGALSTIPDLNGTFIAMNGDVLTNLDLRRLIDFHHEQEAALTIAMHRQTVPIQLGVIEHSDGLIKAYREKPTHHYDVSMGIYVYEPRALEHLPDGACQFPDLVQRLLDAGERVAGFESTAEWYDIGTFGEYERALERLQQDPQLFDG